MSTPKKNLNNNGVMNIDNNESLLIPNGTTLRGKEASRKDNQIASVPKKELLKNTQDNHSKKKKINYPANGKTADKSKSVIILGDSMIKHLNRWEMSKKVNNPGCKIYVKHFTGAKQLA